MKPARRENCTASRLAQLATGTANLRELFEIQMTVINRVATGSRTLSELTTIGFDADDTLWDHERYFQLTQARFAELLRDYADITISPSTCWRRSGGIFSTTGLA